jgi:uncharacterized protein DUF6600/FecR-like protein
MLQRRYAFLTAVMVIVGSLFLSLPALADSDVRIVRLSFIDGDAQVNPGNDDNGFTHAVLNSPVTSGMWLYTPNGGRAEVQFENGSTIRLADDAQIQFTQLSLADSGGKIDVITVDHGTVYFNFIKVKGDDNITFIAGGKTFKITKSSHLRISADDKNVSVAVFRGQVGVEGDKPVDVKSNETLALAVATPDQYNLAQNVDQLGTDAWDKDREGEVSIASNHTSPYNYSDVAYSAEYSSLAAYGNYYNVAGYGQVWQPFGYGMGNPFDPFQNGLWGGYPGFGYMWISPYPWGWVPYRYGAWNYVPVYGWVWSPGAHPVFNRWNLGPNIGTMPPGYIRPVAPVVAPGIKPNPIVVVGHPPNVHPAILAGNAIVGTHPGPTVGAKRVSLDDGEARIGGKTMVVHPVTADEPAKGTERVVGETKPATPAGEKSAPPVSVGKATNTPATPRKEVPRPPQHANNNSAPVRPSRPSNPAPAQHSAPPPPPPHGGSGKPK